MRFVSHGSLKFAVKPMIEMLSQGAEKSAFFYYLTFFTVLVV